jgi:DNA-directed RNA polymerase subunit RPC12/RpoP
MSHHYRCNRCRTRNVWPRALADYKRGRTCKHCGHARFYVDKERVNRKPCTCSGAYHWGAHRPGSPMCDRNPLADANRARRSGAADDVVAALIRKVSAMDHQIGLLGIEEAPPIVQLGVAVHGLLWRPAVSTEGASQLALHVWIMQPDSHLPVYACHTVDQADSNAAANLRAAVQRLQRIGTPVLARGFGLAIARVDDRECLRIGLCSYVDVVPAEQRERMAA